MLRALKGLALIPLLPLIPAPLLHAQQAAMQTRSCSAPDPAADGQFKPGDGWSYTTSAENKGSTLTILKVERIGKIGVIVHVRVQGLALRDANGDLIEIVEDLPTTRKALSASVIQNQRADTVPDFAEAYSNWTQACGGVYIVPVQQAVEALHQKMLRAAHPQ